MNLFSEFIHFTIKIIYLIEFIDSQRQLNSRNFH